MHNKNLSLVYLGKKGGGSHLALALLEALKDLNPDFVYSNKNLFLEEKLRNGLSNIPTGLVQNLISFINPFGYKKLIREISEQIQGSMVIFVMPHPLNLRIISSLNNRNIFVIAHEAQKHKGDFWPTNFFLTRYITHRKCQVIALSKFVAKEIYKGYGLTVRVLPLIVPDFKRYYNFDIQKDLDVVHLGRHRKYKDYNFLINGLRELSKEFTIFLNIPRKFHRTFSDKPKVELRDKYLDEYNFLNTLARAKLVVITHSLASQSGIIPIAVYFGTKIVCPEIGGLPEQFNQSQGATYQPGSMEDFQSKIRDELRNEFVEIECANDFTRPWIRFVSDEISKSNV